MTRKQNSPIRSDQIALRLEPKLRASIMAAADADRRPMAQLIRNILADWVHARPAGSSAEARAALGVAR